MILNKVKYTYQKILSYLKYCDTNADQLNWS
jgi:hypothetical protein